MTVDERIERLTERHEALALSLELESANIAKTRELVDQLSVKVDVIAESVRDLVRVARMHEARISRLEERP